MKFEQEGEEEEKEEEEGSLKRKENSMINKCTR